MTLLVDSHCHINFDPLGAQVPAVLANASENGVGHMLCVAVNLEDFPQVLALAHDHAKVFASVGVHPNERGGHDPSAAELIKLAADDRVVAIGETGLDYYRSTGDMGWQHRRFREHISAAKAVNKQLIIHTRDAAQDTLRIMDEEQARAVGGVMHCFTGDWDTAVKSMDMNFYISFSGIITFKNADALRSVAAKVPADRLLVETDAPYLAPIPFRGKTNQPAYVRHVAECLAEIRKTSLAEITEQTTRNFFTLFKNARATH